MLTKAQYLEWARRMLTPKPAEETHKVDLDALVDELLMLLAGDAAVYIANHEGYEPSIGARTLRRGSK